MEKLKNAWSLFVEYLLAFMYLMATNSHVLTVVVILAVFATIIVFCIWPATFFLALLFAFLATIYMFVHHVVKDFLGDRR